MPGGRADLDVGIAHRQLIGIHGPLPVRIRGPHPGRRTRAGPLTGGRKICRHNPSVKPRLPIDTPARTGGSTLSRVAVIARPSAAAIPARGSADLGGRLTHDSTAGQR